MDQVQRALKKANNHFRSSRKNESPSPYHQLHKKEIRLLKLEAAPHGSRISCSLLQVRLDEAPTYEALSYTWGPPTDEATRNGGFFVECDGYQIDVTANLYAALCQLRIFDQSRLLWIDAICINQQDLMEMSKYAK